MAEDRNYVEWACSDECKSNQLLPTQIIDKLKKETGKEISNSSIGTLSGYSNNIFDVSLPGEEKIIVKQAEFEWAAARFKSARQVSSLLRQNSSIRAPEHIPVSSVTEAPTAAYWYLPYPTLEDLWPDLSVGQKKQAARSLGNLLREMHDIGIPHYGLLHEEQSFESIADYMGHELRDRLIPAVAAQWAEVLPVVDQLLAMCDNLPGPEINSTLVHNDLHLGNILCEVKQGKIMCIGLLDLEEARGASWESDLASAMTLHHPLFAREGEKGEWLNNIGKHIVEGYGKEPDAELLRFFRVYHLINLGFFSAWSGDDWHARMVGEEAAELLESN